MGAEPGGEGEVDRVAAGEVADGLLDEVLTHVAAGDDDDDDDAEALEQRRERVDTVPDVGGGHLGEGVGPVLRCHAHRPARFACPRPARLSRRRSASARGRPGIVASVAAEAVWSLTVARPNIRSIGPVSTSTNWRRP
ncbi:Uncharacterised protein [Mycobacteroides abscessus subsp. abscessus]|nr:Uncharacterised protein [Mycobacteroides abscessus subsp. abscessus]